MLAWNVWIYRVTLVLTLFMSVSLSATEQTFGGNFCLQSARGSHCLSDHKGHVVLLYFGYTACPDICPTSLQTLSRAFAELPVALQDKTDMIMVTLDPDRDNLEKLTNYLSFFHPKLVGLTGSTLAIDQVVTQYGAKYEKINLLSSELGYAIDHSASIYLIDSLGNLLGQFKHGAEVADLVQGVVYAHAQQQR